MRKHTTSASVILAIDIGNTSVDLAVFRGKRVVWRDKISVRPVSRMLLSLKGIKIPFKLDAVAVSCVNPPVGRRIAAWSKKKLGMKPLVVGKDLPISMPVRLSSGQAGDDRICSAVAAYERCKGACIVVDFGTALKMQVVNSQGEFLGGAIMCGISLSARALHEQTALLPHVRLRTPRRAIGRNTEEALRSGLMIGSIGAVRHLLECIKTELNCPVTVFATGSDSKSLGKAIGSFDSIVPVLALEGIRVLYEQSVDHL